MHVSIKVARHVVDTDQAAVAVAEAIIDQEFSKAVARIADRLEESGMSDVRVGVEPPDPPPAH